ncbi:hypothetical protein [Diaphorobacter sp. HDW4A]|uniref:hypothetical protein n=1 Tax=Diaphorobacter sp. HDW4A TaxID=2714924 RepID=UPI00197D3472|nr:hypothetical protein [Diaphorobacter sp. HDW4A]
MALPSSGPISLLQIAQEFGGSAPHELSEYYGIVSGIPASGAISLSQFHGKAAAGEATYTANADFTVPAGVTSICFVAVGRGGNGTFDGSGGGGALGWKNNVAVTPGQVIQVRFNSAASGNTSVTIGGVVYQAGNGYFGPPNVPSSSGGSRSGNFDGGGAGGGGYGAAGSGGGGAGGYLHAGGQGGSTNYSGVGSTTGGGGGGGVDANYRKGGGGGVGLKGVISGTSDTVGPGVGGGGGQGGAGGASDYTAVGGAYGGGGSASNSTPEAQGGVGAVRIIWGAGRSFPYAAA